MWNRRQIQYNVSKDDTIQDVITAINTGGVFTLTVVSGNANVTFASKSIENGGLSSMILAGENLVKREVIASGGAVTATKEIDGQYQKLLLKIPVGATRQNAVTAINTQLSDDYEAWLPWGQDGAGVLYSNAGAIGYTTQSGFNNHSTKYLFKGGFDHSDLGTVYRDGTNPWRYHNFYFEESNSQKDGAPLTSLTFFPGNTYVIDWFDVGEPPKFSTTERGTHNSGSIWTDPNTTITTDTMQKKTTIVVDKSWLDGDKVAERDGNLSITMMLFLLTIYSLTEMKNTTFQLIFF